MKPGRRKAILAAARHDRQHLRELLLQCLALEARASKLEELAEAETLPKKRNPANRAERSAR